VVLEGKYWKRKLAAVTAEYKKWRMFYRNRLMGWSAKDGNDMVRNIAHLHPVTHRYSLSLFKIFKPRPQSAILKC
jgi:hypothetical protein